MIPEISMNNNPEMKTHAYMQVSITPKIYEVSGDDNFKQTENYANETRNYSV